MPSLLHHNLFVYYRGPSAQKLGEIDAHRQLENNATKALINVLEHGDPALARAFAERFAPATAAGWPAAGGATFYLQGGPAEVPDGARVLLGLSIDGALDAKAPAPPDGAGTLIDAAIAPPHGGLIAIETKVVELLNPHQLAGHRKRWEIASDDVVLLRWVDVWSWARDAHQAVAEPVSRYLLDQFREYLEILGFGRWAGFREEDFAQFSEWSWDHQPVLRARMKAVWERVLELMPSDDAARLGAVEAGRLPTGSTHAWAQTNRGQAGTNLTLELHADELQFNLVGWNDAQARRLEAWLLDHAAETPDLDLVVYQRRAKRDHKGAPFWMHATAEIPVTFTAQHLRAGEFAPWLAQWRSGADLVWTRLAYHLRHTWPRDEVLERGESLATEIAHLASETLPLLRSINQLA
jgi:hypothetical protein